MTTLPPPLDIHRRLTDAHSQIAQLLSICGAPGIAYGIIHHGQLLSTNACGYRDVEKQLAPNRDTKFLIGSISKTFLSAAVGLAVRDDRIKLDAPLSQYLPTFSPRNGDPQVRDATIRQVLSHTSGLGNPQIFINGPRDTALQGEAGFVNFANQIPTTNKKGRRFGRWTYSNLGYGLVALALQNVYGCRFADLVQEQLLNPLRLHRTAVFKADGCDVPAGTGTGQEEDDRGGCRRGGDDAFVGDQGQDIDNDVNVRNPPDQNVAFPYAKLQDGTYSRLITHGNAKQRFGRVSDLLHWGAVMISPQPPPPLSMITTLIQDRDSWDQGPQQWYYHMGWARAQMPTHRLGILSFNCCSADCPPILDFQDKDDGYGQAAPTPTQILQTNGVMNGSTAVIYTFPNAQTVIVACANAASDGDAADWTAKILAQSLFCAQAPNSRQVDVDFLAMAELEAQARRDQYQKMLRDWEAGRRTTESPSNNVCLLDYVGVYEGLGTTLEISIVYAAAGGRAAGNLQDGSVVVNGRGCCSYEDDTRQQQQRSGPVELQLVFNGVLESAQRLEWYCNDVLSFFPRTRDQWLGEMMFNWDFVDSGLLKFTRESSFSGDEGKSDDVSGSSSSSSSLHLETGRVVSLTWAWDEAEDAGKFTKI
ncbi:beta-lactamase/transpeptidase-like protein [Leptodontidium sp. MPI-SDFR-AT-0119]|nr:beta-lactamase/transpeptidase-like protein [Leptodontidium sp. MPI-SDFR-AT-0119]